MRLLVYIQTLCRAVNTKQLAKGYIAIVLYAANLKICVLVWNVGSAIGRSEYAFEFTDRSNALEDGDTLHEVTECTSSEEEEESESEEDDDGWITPGNVDAVNKAMTGVSSVETNPECTVGCLTTDFAMQVFVEGESLDWFIHGFQPI